MDTRLAKNRSGNWEIRWSEQKPDGSWGTRSVSCRTTSKIEAQAFQRAWHREGLAEIAASRNKDEVDLLALIDVYGEKKPDQYYALRKVRLYVLHHGTRFEDLDVAWSEDYVTAAQAKGLSESTARRHLGAFLACLNYASERKQLQGLAVPTFKLPPDGDAREVFLDEAQEAEFYQLALDDSPPEKRGRLTRLSRFVALALDTAARRASIEQLTWDRVDMVRGVIDYRDPSKRKTRKRRGEVAVSDRLRPILERAYRERRNEYVLDEPGSVKTAWYTFLRRHRKFQQMSLNMHDLRRTWATLAARAGVDLWEIAGVLADTVATVEKHYAKHRPDHQKRAVNARANAQTPKLRVVA